MKKTPRLVTWILLAAAAIGAVASTASVLWNLRHALGRRRREPPPERERVHEALKPILAEIDWDAWHDTFGRLPENFDREALRRALTVEPPLSRAVIEERDEGRWSSRPRSATWTRVRF